jgi:histidinol-phosphate aminotransferase
MSNRFDYIKPEVRAIAPYTLKLYEARIKLNQNENPFGFPETLKEEVWRRLRDRDWARYPDFYLREITQRLAAFAEVPDDWVLVGNGSNELLQMTFLTCLGRGDHLVVPVPTFSLYRLQGLAMGATVHEVPLADPDFQLPVEQVIETARAHRARIVVLCSPNNPTGNAFREADIRRVLEESGSLVLLDEAYVEFAGCNMRPLLEEYENLLILRTFSKAWALGGARVGYVLGRPELLREIAKVKLPYGLNILSETAALVALEHHELLAQQVRRIVELRDVLYDALCGIPGVHPYPSQTNFILCRFDRPSGDVFAACLERGILIRDVSGYPGLANHLRISVGTAEESAALVKCLLSVFSDQ